MTETRALPRTDWSAPLPDTAGAAWSSGPRGAEPAPSSSPAAHPAHAPTGPAGAGGPDRGPKGVPDGQLGMLGRELDFLRARLAQRIAITGLGELRHPEVYRADLDLRWVVTPILDLPAGFLLLVDA